jgi:hypothetical protein
MRPRFILPVFCLLVLATSFAQAGNTVPGLTGSFTGPGGTDGYSCQAGYNGFTPGTPAYSGWGQFTLSSQLNVTASSSYTSLSESSDGGLDSLGNPWCVYSYNGTVNGSIVASLGSLTFTGAFVGGNSSGYWSQEGGVQTQDTDMNASFRGTWSNGWYSVGTVDFWVLESGGFGNEGATLNITTSTPEPSGLVLLGTGLVPMIAVLRRKLLRG